jgi:intracellular septation protein
MNTASKSIKFLEEYGPLLVFFALNARGAQWFDMAPEQGLFIATAGFMAALAVSMLSTILRGKRPNNMTLLSGAFVFVFGGITLFLQDETFIKIKPTLIYILFAGILGFGLMRRQSYLQKLMGAMLPLDDAGWMALTRRWTLFFLFLAAVNEVIWRTQTTDVWVSFKVFGIFPLMFGFILLQIPLITKHTTDDETP